jgi:hypothetical protein
LGDLEILSATIKYLLLWDIMQSAHPLSPQTLAVCAFFDLVMPAMAEQPISALVSMLPIKLLVASLIVAAVAKTIYYMLPLRLTDTLIALIIEAEEIYIEAHEMGLLSTAENEMLDACANNSFYFCAMYLHTSILHQSPDSSLHHNRRDPTQLPFVSHGFY